MSDEDKTQERTQLGAQLPPVPPDEVPGILGLRDLTSDELGHFESDAALIRSTAPVMPYARAAEAVRALGDVVDDLEPEPSARARKRLAQALRAAASALRELPEGLVARIPEDVEFVQAASDVRTQPAYRLASALDTVQSEHLVRQPNLGELVVSAERVAAWPAAKGLVPLGEAIGLMTIVSQAIDAGAHLAARWLLAQRRDIDEASRRIARLSGEVIEGAPIVLTIRIPPGDDGHQPDSLVMTPNPLPLLEIQNLQAALRKAEDLVADKPRKPAVRGARRMYGEQVAATLGVAAEAPRNADDRGADPNPAARALDLPAVLAHLHAGAIRLEQAWSRALERDDVEALAAEWTSFLHAMASEVAHADRDLEDDLTRFELPLPEDDLIALSLESDEHARRTAEAIVLGRIAQGVDSLRRPTKLSADVTGRRITFFSSGAFAGVRDQLTLLSMLKSNPLSDRRLMLVNKAAAHGDPEAVLFHAAALLRRRGNVAGKVQSRILEASDRLAAGEAHDLGTLTILADAALRLFSDP